MKMRRFMLLLLVIADLAALPVLAKAQSSATPPDSPGTVANTPPAQRDLTYTRPTEKTKFHNYIFDMIGPYPILGAALSAGINQADNTPPEWRQGAEAYGKRFGSNFGIAAVSTTTRYTLAEVFGEDTLYYRCECKGFFPRLSHAMISTLVTRRGDDGHRVFSVPHFIQVADRGAELQLHTLAVRKGGIDYVRPIKAAGPEARITSGPVGNGICLRAR